jgi:hypothetical protein
MPTRIDRHGVKRLGDSGPSWSRFEREHGN